MWAGKRTLLCVRGLLVCADTSSTALLWPATARIFILGVYRGERLLLMYILCCLELLYRHNSAESNLKKLNGACFVYVK